MPEAGFSIVEVIVAMAVLVVITAATVAVLMASLEAIRGNSDRVQAASIARTHLATLRSLGADALAPNEGVNTDVIDDFQATGFTVTTTSRWVGFAEDTNPCASVVGGSPRQGYVQSRIAVIGGELRAPQYIDAVIPPLEGVPEAVGGAATVYVRDQVDAPLAGWQVTASSSASGASTQVGTSGADGCIHFANLVPGDWTMTVGLGPGWMAEPGTTVTRAVPIAIGDNTAVDSFVVSRPVAAIRLSAGSAPDYPLLPDLPVVVRLGSLGTVQDVMTDDPLILPGSGQQLWPDPLGYSASLGCSDEGAPTSIPVTPGGESAIVLPTAVIDIVGPRESEVTVRHAQEAQGTGVCAGTPTVLGPLTAAPDPDQPDAVLGPSGRTGVSLPRGTWTFSTPGQTDVTVVIGEALSCSVHWPPAGGQESASPSPSPSGTVAPAPAPTLPTEQPLFDRCPSP
jgi:type II secretory pathway pseudopilin PulG